MAAGDHSLTLSVLSDRLAVSRLDPQDEDGMLPMWALDGELSSITRTMDELSVVCAEDAVPEGVQVELGWRCLKAHGPFDFSTVGVLVSLAGPLAEAGISIFALSTYDTDYLMVKESDLTKATRVLEDRGHTILR